MSSSVLIYSKLSEELIFPKTFFFAYYTNTSKQIPKWPVLKHKTRSHCKERNEIFQPALSLTRVRKAS